MQQLEYIFPLKLFSLNQLYKAGNGWLYKDPASEIFKHDFLRVFKCDLGFKNYMKIRGPVEVELLVFWKGKQACDVDNVLKLLLDCCKNVLFDDDKMIMKLTTEKRIETSKNCFIIRVKPHFDDAMACSCGTCLHCKLDAYQMPEEKPDKTYEDQEGKEEQIERKKKRKFKKMASGEPEAITSLQLPKRSEQKIVPKDWNPTVIEDIEDGEIVDFTGLPYKKRTKLIFNKK